MTTAAAHQLELPEPRARPARRKKTARGGFLGGALSIVALAILLAGVVALNVAVLQLNVRLDRLGRDRAQLRAANATLAAQLSSAAATPQVEALAGKRLGLVPAAPELTTYVELERRR
jgi:hypothetical protein